MKQARLILVLNAHLPFVRHPEHPQFFEESWLFEAINETYLPLLRLFHTLEADQIPFKITLSVSPTLTAMLGDPLLQERFRKYLALQKELAARELERTAKLPDFAPLARLYQERLLRNHKDFEELYQGNLLKGFQYFLKSGSLELMTTAATHAVLPLYQPHPEVLSAQISTAVESHCRAFGKNPKGFWLPECAYAPGLDALLKKHKLDYFFIASHGLLFQEQAPAKGVFAPVRTQAGVAAFAREQQATNALWSAEDGYPGDPDYREFYRDIGFDLPLDYVGPYLLSGDNPSATGFKYYAVTGRTDQKRVYNPERAQAKVQEHAENFIYQRLMQARKVSPLLQGALPLISAPYDAELFGHFWYEGIAWLEALFRLRPADQGLELTTPSEVLAEKPELEAADLPFSSWATGGYAELWLDGTNDWIIQHNHKLVQRMKELVDRFPNEGGRRERALNQAAREVLLSQASDWPQMIKMGTTVDYARRRISEHVSNFNRIYDSLSSNTLDTEWLTTLEKRNNLFPDLDYRLFRRLV